MPEIVANFSAGPSALPPSVRNSISQALACAPDCAPSLIEVSHRGARFLSVYEELLHRLKELMGVGDTHEVLLLQGGANQQFAQFPLNFGATKPPAFLITGHWGEKAFAEAKRIGPAKVFATSKSSQYTQIPALSEIDDACSYLHYTGNETIHGVQFDAPPRLKQPARLVADLSSEFLSRRYDFCALAGFYAGAQKNLGVAGLTIVGLSKDWLCERQSHAHPNMPDYLNYQAWVDSASMLNTPVTFAWWVALEMLRWIEAEGGLDGLEARNTRKAERLYGLIDGSDFYINPVQASVRSVMNVPFWIHDGNLHAMFVQRAEEAGLLGLKGHRAVGGLRASLYNSIEERSVIALTEFMKEFERCHG